MFDIWNQSIPLAEKIYKTNNYKIKENQLCKNGICYVFFSSNNIWFPNTEEAFRRSFIDNDYYEWQRFENIKAEKIIFIRDIYKSWYVAGINETVNSIDALCSMLKKETNGMKVITVGSSAGGYMAALAAAYLKAEYGICFSAQFDITVKGALEVNPLLQKYSSDLSRNKYYKISDIIKESKVDIYYFLPAFCSQDLDQLSRVEGVENIHILKIGAKRHGVPVLTGNLNCILQMNKDALNKLFADYNKKVVGILQISVRLSGIAKTCSFFINDIIKVVKNKVRR